MEQDKKEIIRNNIMMIQDKISDTAAKYGRCYDDITLIGVTKRFPADYAKIAFQSGLNDLGENRVDELLEKKEVLFSEGMFPNWHMIGTLQRKKVKKLIGNTSLIHSADSFKLVDEISTISVDRNISTPILLQVNISGEDSKQGFSEDELLNRVMELTGMNGISIKGLMTMAPFTNDIYVLEKVFSETYDLYCQLKEKNVFENFNILSMGMSNDYQIAIKYGATHIRVGTAIFGERA